MQLHSEKHAGRTYRPQMDFEQAPASTEVKRTSPKKAAMSQDDFKAASEAVEQEIKAVKRLKRLSIGNSLNFDPDLPLPNSENYYNEDSAFMGIHDSNQPQYQNSIDKNLKRTKSKLSKHSITRSLESVDSISIHSIDSVDSLESIRFHRNEDQHDDSENDDEHFDDAIDDTNISKNRSLRSRTLIPESSSMDLEFNDENVDFVDLDQDSMFNDSDVMWVPATAHPKISPENFKKHIKVKVDQKKKERDDSMNLRKLKNDQHDDVRDNYADTSEHNKENNESRKPSLKELTFQLEKLSRRAGLDDDDAVTLARSLSTRSIGISKIEKEAYHADSEEKEDHLANSTSIASLVEHDAQAGDSQINQNSGVLGRAKSRKILLRNRLNNHMVRESLIIKDEESDADYKNGSNINDELIDMDYNDLPADFVSNMERTGWSNYRRENSPTGHHLPRLPQRLRGPNRIDSKVHVYKDIRKIHNAQRPLGIPQVDPTKSKSPSIRLPDLPITPDGNSSHAPNAVPISPARSLPDGIPSPATDLNPYRSTSNKPEKEGQKYHQKQPQDHYHQQQQPHPQQYQHQQQVPRQQQYQQHPQYKKYPPTQYSDDMSAQRRHRPHQQIPVQQPSQHQYQNYIQYQQQQQQQYQQQQKQQRPLRSRPQQPHNQLTHPQRHEQNKPQIAPRSRPSNPHKQQLTSQQLIPQQLPLQQRHHSQQLPPQNALPRLQRHEFQRVQSEDNALISKRSDNNVPTSIAVEEPKFLNKTEPLPPSQAQSPLNVNVEKAAVLHSRNRYAMNLSDVNVLGPSTELMAQKNMKESNTSGLTIIGTPAPVLTHDSKAQISGSKQKTQDALLGVSIDTEHVSEKDIKLKIQKQRVDKLEREKGIDAKGNIPKEKEKPKSKSAFSSFFKIKRDKPRTSSITSTDSSEPKIALKTKRAHSHGSESGASSPKADFISFFGGKKEKEREKHSTDKARENINEKQHTDIVPNIRVTEALASSPKLGFNVLNHNKTNEGLVEKKEIKQELENGKANIVITDGQQKKKKELQAMIPESVKPELFIEAEVTDSISETSIEPQHEYARSAAMLESNGRATLTAATANTEAISPLEASLSSPSSSDGTDSIDIIDSVSTSFTQADPIQNHVDDLKEQTGAVTNDGKVVAAPTIAKESSTVSTTSENADSKESNELIKQSLRETLALNERPTKPNQPLEMKDSAFGFPLPPVSRSSLVMLDHRFPVHVERAIYRLSHLKLADPKRQLRQQVLLSNFMYSYLNLVNHTLWIQSKEQEGVSEGGQLLPDENATSGSAIMATADTTGAAFV